MKPDVLHFNLTMCFLHLIQEPVRTFPQVLYHRFQFIAVPSNTLRVYASFGRIISC